MLSRHAFPPAVQRPHPAAISPIERDAPAADTRSFYYRVTGRSRFRIHRHRSRRKAHYLIASSW